MKVIDDHIKEINKEDYQDPIDRRLTIASMDAFMDTIMAKRKDLITELYNTSAVELRLGDDSIFFALR